jgi:hypothetical protein
MVAQLEEIQSGYIANSDRIDPAGWRARSQLRRIPENLARLMSPLL